MPNQFLLMPVLLALVVGVLSYILPMKEGRGRNIFLFFGTLLVSISVWSLLLNRPEGEFILYRFNQTMSVTLKLDGLGCFFAGMTSVLWPLAMLYAFEYMEKGKHNKMFFAFYLFTYGVTQGICVSGNMLTIFVFYEMLTLVTLPLVLSRFNEESQFASRRYAIYCLGGSAFAFIGVIFLSVYGNGAPFVLGGVLNGVEADKNLMLAVYLISFFGFGVKAAVFPLHGWLPLASVAPTPVTALLHAVAVVKSGIFLIIRLTYYSFGADYLQNSWAQKIALGFIVFTMVYGAVMAVKERHFKRRLAYSTVSNLSYILFGVLLCTPEGLEAGLLHMLFHAFIKIGAFMAAGAFMHKTEKEYLFELDGVGRRMPLTFGLYTVSALGLVGIPLFSGFVSKYRLVMAGLSAGSVMGTVGVLGLILAAFLCALYMLTVSVRAFFPREERRLYAESTLTDPTWRMLLPMALFAAVTVLFGVWPQPVLSLVEAIATGTM